MNYLQKQILLGCLLGDSSLQTYTNGKTWRVRFIQGELHKDYLFHLYEVFKDYVNTPPKSVTDKNGYTRWYFNTLTSPEFIYFAELFYTKQGPKWRKIVSKEMIDLLTPKVLSYWYMDDGSLKKVGSNFKTYIFCTDSFTLDEVKILGEAIKKNFGVHVSYQTNRPKQYRIYIPKKEYKKIRSIMEPLIHESLEYKL